MIWPHFTKEKPCPSCGHNDWTCRFGDIAYVCMRVVSEHPSKDGGWYHFFEGKKIQYIPMPRREKAPPRINAASMIERWSKDESLIYKHAIALGVSVQSLIDLSASYSFEYNAWAFPMRDGNNEIIGIRLRNNKGKKWAVTGSRSGIFIPQIKGERTAYLVEGPTDTAAMLTLGLYAIGRPSCNAGGEMVKEHLKKSKIFKVVIVADNDSIKNGKRAGIEGAKKLQKDIGLSSVIWMPPSPIKDVREFVRKGGTRQLIESDINSKTWENPF